MYQTIVARKICQPSYDAVCLQGGCGYCNTQGKWIGVNQLQKKVERTRPELREDFLWGVRHGFANANVRYQDGSTKH